jgi:Fe-S cluster assembly protein SufD
MSQRARAAGREHYLNVFRAEARDGGAGGSPGWLTELRQQAIERFANVGFPNTRQEEWRFTDVAPLAREPFSPVGSPGRASAKDVRGLLGGESALRLVFVDGVFAKALSETSRAPAGVRLESLATALDRDGDLLAAHLGRHALVARSPFTALSTAFMRDGALVYVPRGVAVEQPVSLLFLTTAAAEGRVIYPRNLVVVDTEAAATVVETHVALEPSHHFTNAVTEVVLGDGARGRYYRLQRENDGAFHMATSQSHQGRDSTFASLSVAFGAGLSRHDVGGVLDGTGGHLALNGLSVLTGRQHMDYHTTIDHARPHCESRELFNGIFRDHARGVFNGRIVVRPGAQQTDSKQTNNNVLLSRDARADSQPQLEIYADDVKCTHGATIGPLDADAVFYLQARGVPADEARHLLTYGFAADILAHVELPDIREHLDRLVRARLAA